MKSWTLLLVVVYAGWSFGGEPPVREPAALVAAREDYQGQIKALVEPITAEYLKKLDGLMKGFGAKGELESAQAVQAEMKLLAGLTAREAVSKAEASKPAAPHCRVVGKWTWRSKGEIVEIHANGHCTTSADRQRAGKWVAFGKEGYKFNITWATKDRTWLNGLAVIDDSLCLVLDGSDGGTWAAKRIK
ncbi:MAG: hypothetical protein ABSG86_00530 [Thermoguttaceae bacterium]|jgi:hypothetical protein